MKSEGLVDVLKVISDTNRLRIVNLLFHKELCVCEIEYLLELTQSNLSKHLKIMSDAGFLDKNRQKKFAYYHLKKDFLETCPFIIEIIEKELVKEEIFMNDQKNLLTYRESHMPLDCLAELILEKKIKNMVIAKEENIK